MLPAGIAALVLAIIMVFIPLFGAMATVASGLLAAFAGGGGLRYGQAAIGVNVLNLLLLSPAWRGHALGGWERGAWAPLATWVGMIVIQIMAFWVLSLVEKRRRRRRSWVSGVTASDAPE